MHSVSAVPMRRRHLLSILSLLASFLLCAIPSFVQGDIYLARATIRGSINYPVIYGTVLFTQTAPGAMVSIQANLTGLAPGEYAWHVHTYGDASSGLDTNVNGGDIDGKVVGSHFDNGLHPLHGCWPSANRHVGDLGNITVKAFDVMTSLSFTRDLIDLSPSNSSIVGRMIIIHRYYDHCTQPTGEGGTMLAQGVVGIVDPRRYGFVPTSTAGPNGTTIITSTTNLAGISPPWAGNTPPLGDAPVVASAWITSPPNSLLDDETDVSGRIVLQQVFHSLDGSSSDRVRILVNLTGLQPWSSHSFYISTWGDDSSPNDPGSFGTHWNPNGTMHGLPNAPVQMRHAGDLGSVLADQYGHAFADFTIDCYAGVVGIQNFIGRTVVLGQQPDTGEDSTPAGSGSDPSSSIRALLALGVIGLSPFRPSPPPTTGWFARATLRGSSDFPSIHATVLFTQPAGPGLFSPVTIQGTFFGLPLGPGGQSTNYALHIHSFGDITSDPIALSVIGAHFNPLNKPHGCPPNQERHAGDIGNVAVSSLGTFQATFINPLIDLGDSIKSIIGRALVLHNGTDHCVQPSGNSGPPVAQGVIGIVQPFGQVTDPSIMNGANNLQANQSTTTMIAKMFPTLENPDIKGTIQMHHDHSTKKFRVVVSMSGIDPFTAHGLHIHTYGVDDTYALSSLNLANALGGHYNPEHMPHDLPSPITHARHLGDLGVLVADAAGEVHSDFTLDFSSPVFSTSVGNLLGRSIVLQASADSGEQPQGGSTAILAVGVLGLSTKPMPPGPTVYSSFCDRYAGVLGMNHTFFIQSVLTRAIWGVDAARTGMRFPDGTGPPAMHEVRGCIFDNSPVQGWFNGDIGYRTKHSPYPLYPPAPDYTDLSSKKARTFLVHMTQYFALSLGCSGYESSDYEGVSDMHAVHANMYLTQSAFSYFTSQLRLAFTSFGCLESDVSEALLPLVSRFLRGSVTGASNNVICTEPDCMCAPNLCGADCTPTACQVAKVNGTIPTYDRGYSYAPPSTAAAHAPVLSLLLALALTAVLVSKY